jgi:ABC-type oligopeptide transport system substrate-binding subunit
VTAGDFAYAWRRVLEPANQWGTADLLGDIRGASAFHRGECEWAEVGVRAADELTLIVELEGPTAYFLHLVSRPVTYAVPEHVVEAHGEAWMEMGNIVTNGPFRLEAWQPGESMVLVRNPLYHRRCDGNVQRVEMSLVWYSPALMEMYEADELDLLPTWAGPPGVWVGPRLGFPEDEYFPIAFPSTAGVAFDVTRPPFDDIRVRRAFVLGTDRERLTAVVGQGMDPPASGGFVPHAMPGHSPGIALPYDPQQARQLLAQAGYPGGRGFPAVHAFAWSSRVPWAEHLQTHWRDNLGVDVAWNVGEWSCFVAPGELTQLWLTLWHHAYPDPDNFLRVYSPARRGWRNETYDNLVERARREMDPEERMKLYRQADRILIEEAVIMPTHYAIASVLVKPWVRKPPSKEFGLWLWKNVIIEPH